MSAVQNIFFRNKAFGRFVLIAGILSPLWLFLFNFSRYVISHKASLEVEVLAVTENGKELSNLCRISPSGKIDSFYVVKPNYFSREDEWGQGKGYIKTITFRATELSKIKVLLMRCGARPFVWTPAQIRSQWKKVGDNYILEKVHSENMPLYGKVMNYAGNVAVARAIFIPTFLMSLILITLALFFFSINKHYHSSHSLSQNIYTHLFNTRQGKIFAWTSITAIVIFYLYNYFTLPPYIHAETYLTFPQLANNANEGFWSNMLTKSLDLGRVEEGGYRPRALAFIIGYTDTNLMIWLNHKFPGFGPRLPFMLVAAFLLAYSVYKLARTLFPKIPVEAALLIGCSMLFFQNFQSTTYLYLRSAKALCPGVCVWLLNYYFRHQNSTKAISPVRVILYAALLLVACTLDEQVIVVVALILLLSVISTFKSKNVGISTYSSAGALLLYIVYHFTAASFLFGPYTPAGIHRHGHSFTDPFLSFGLESIQRAAEIWMHLVLSLGASLVLVLPAAVITSVLWMKLGRRDKVISAVIFLFSYTLIGAVIGSHRTAYYCKELWNGAYFLPAACLMLAGVLFIWSKGISETMMPHAWVLIHALFLSTILINTQRIPAFYNNYTSVEAGDRGTIVDPNDWMIAEHAKFFEHARKPRLQLESLVKK